MLANGPPWGRPVYPAAGRSNTHAEPKRESVGARPGVGAGGEGGGLEREDLVAIQRRVECVASVTVMFIMVFVK